jgi:hypothetical protein
MNITVRDFFAAQAMQQLMTVPTAKKDPTETIAIGAYLMADAMMKERERNINK